MVIGKKPIVTIIVFNENSETSCKPLVDSINKLEALLKAKLEFSFIVFDKKLSNENRQLALSLRKYMPVKFVDFYKKYGKDRMEFYHRGYKYLIKKETDTVTREEIDKIILEYRNENEL